MKTVFNFSQMQFIEFIQFLVVIKNSGQKEISAGQLPKSGISCTPSVVEVSKNKIKVEFPYPVSLPDGITGKCFEFVFW